MKGAVVAAVGRRLDGDRGLLLGDEARIRGAAARTGWSPRDDAEVIVDVEKRRVAAEVAAQQGAVDVVLSCVQVGDDRRIDVPIIAASGAVREALPVVQDGV